MEYIGQKGALLDEVHIPYQVLKANWSTDD